GGWQHLSSEDSLLHLHVYLSAASIIYLLSINYLPSASRATTNRQTSHRAPLLGSGRHPARSRLLLLSSGESEVIAEERRFQSKGLLIAGLIRCNLCAGRRMRE